MIEPDSLNQLLREWQQPAVDPNIDQRVLSAYRETMQMRKPEHFWTRFWNTRLSVPVPVLLAAMIALALLLWFRTTPAPTALPAAGDVVTTLNATGFQPLPNGDARIVTVKETH